MYYSSTTGQVVVLLWLGVAHRGDNKSGSCMKHKYNNREPRKVTKGERAVCCCPCTFYTGLWKTSPKRLKKSWNNSWGSHRWHLVNIPHSDVESTWLIKKQNKVYCKRHRIGLLLQQHIVGRVKLTCLTTVWAADSNHFANKASNRKQDPDDLTPLHSSQ